MLCKSSVATACMRPGNKDLKHRTSQPRGFPLVEKTSPGSLLKPPGKAPSGADNQPSHPQLGSHVASRASTKPSQDQHTTWRPEGRDFLNLKTSAPLPSLLLTGPPPFLLETQCSQPRGSIHCKRGKALRLFGSKFATRHPVCHPAGAFWVFPETHLFLWFQMPRQLHRPVGAVLGVGLGCHGRSSRSCFPIASTPGSTK